MVQKMLRQMKLLPDLYMACTSDDLGYWCRVFERNFSYSYDAEISQSITNMVMKHYFDRRHTTKALLLLELNFIYDYTIGIISPRTWKRTRRWDSATQALSPFISERVGRLSYRLDPPAHGESEGKEEAIGQ